MRIKHSSPDEIGQVYVSKINLFLFLGVIGLVIGFKTSENLASVYGISVKGAMAIDTLLVAYVMVPHENIAPLALLHNLKHNKVLHDYGRTAGHTAVALLRAREFHFSLMEISFFVGKEKVVAKHSSPIFLAPFIFMHRAMQGATEYFKIPFDHAIEIGGHIEL